MATLDLQIDATQAVQAAQTFMRVLEDIKRAAAAVDVISFSKTATGIDRAVKNLASMETAIKRVVTELGTLQYTLNSIAQAPHVDKLIASFIRLRDVLREIRSDLRDVESGVRMAAQSAERVGTAPRPRARRAPATVVENGVAVTSTTAVVATSVAAMTALAPLGIALATVGASGRIAMGGLSGASLALRQFEGNAKSVIQVLEAMNQRFVQMFATVNRLRFALSAPQERGLVPFQFQARPVGQLVRREDVRDIGGVGGAVKGLGETFDATGVKKDRFRKNLQGLGNDAKQPGLVELRRALLGLQVVLGGITLVALGRSFRAFSEDLVETGKQLQHNRSLFLSATRGNIEEAETLRAQARGIAQEFGIPLLQMEENAARLAGAALGSNLQGELFNKTLRGVSAAVSVLGTGTDKATNILKVFTDILGKGRVQSEEVVKQFGNAVPGAYRRVADALGMTTAQLTQNIQRGTLLATDVVSKVGIELGKIYEDVAKKQSNTLIGAFNNLNSAITGFKEAILLGGAEQGFIDFFKGMADVLRDPSVMAAARQLGEALGKILAGALSVATWAIGVFVDNYRLFAALLIGGAVAASLVTLAVAISLVGISLQALAGGWMGVVLAVIAFIATIAGVGSYFALFNTSTEKATEETEKFTRAQREAAERARAEREAIEEQSRALIQAEERIHKEMRTFVEDQRAAAEALDLVARGVSTTSTEFESFVKVQERVRALERAGTFRAFGEGAEQAKAQFTEQARAAEDLTRALAHLLELYKQLHSAQQEQRTEAFTAASIRTLGPNISQEALSLQAEYDKRVIPMLEKTRQILGSLTDPDQITKIAGAFNTWNKAILEQVHSMHALQMEMRGLVDLAENLRDLRREQVVTEISGQLLRPGGREATPIQPGVQLVESLVPRAMAAQFSVQARLLPGLEKVMDTTGKSFEDMVKKAGELYGETQGTATEQFGKHVDKFGTAVDKLAGAPGTAGVAGATAGVVGSTAGASNASERQLANVYQGVIEQTAQKYGIGSQVATLTRLIRQESGFNPAARGTSGEIGLGQIMPATGREMGFSIEDLKDPIKNIDATVRYYARLYTQFGGNVERTLMAYNTGPNAGVTAKGQMYARAVLAQPAGVPTVGASVFEPYIELAKEQERRRFGALEEVQKAETPGLVARARETVAGLFGGGLKDALTGVVADFFGATKTVAAEQSKQVAEAFVNPIASGLASDFRTVQEVSDTVSRSTEEALRKQLDLRKQMEGMAVPETPPALRAAVAPLQAPQTTAQGMFQEVQNVLQQQIGQDIWLTQEAQVERSTTAFNAFQKALERFGVTQDDITNKTDKYKTALLTAAIAAQDSIQKRIQQGNQHLMQMERENEDLQRQIGLLNVVPALRDLETNAINRRNQALQQNALTTAEQRQAFQAREQAIRASENQLRIQTYADQFRRNMQEEIGLMQAQLGFMRLEPQQRALATEALRQYVEIEKQHLDPATENALKAQVDEWLKLKAAIENANGPLQQYIDQLSEAQKNFFQQNIADFFRGGTQALAESLWGLRGRLEERSRGVEEAEARSRARIASIPAWDIRNRQVAEREGAASIRRARENQPSVLETITGPLVSFFDDFTKKLFTQAIEQLSKPLVEAVNKMFNIDTRTPEVAAIEKSTQEIVGAIERTGGVGGRGGGPIQAVGGEGPMDRVNYFRSQFGEAALPEGSTETVSTLTNYLGDMGTTVVQTTNSLSGLSGGLSSFVNSLGSILGNLFSSLGGGGGGGGWGSLITGVIGLFGGGGGVASAGEAAAAVQGFRDAGFTQGLAMSRGGIVGIDSGAQVHLPLWAFSGVNRFQSGGMVGTDTYPALLTPGEGVFTQAQMKSLAPVGSGETRANIFYVSLPNVTDSHDLRRTADQTFSEMATKLERAAVRDGHRRVR